VSVHGGNRLGTNSLLDLLVFGRSAGNHIVEQALERRSHKPLPKDAAEPTLARLARLDAATSGERAADVAQTLRWTMQLHCGVFRNGQLLGEGVNKVMELEQRAHRIAISDKSKIFNTARVEALELDNLIEVAKASIVSAQARRESRGAQARSDFPNRDDANWLKHTLWYREGNRLDYKPVNLKPLSVDAFPPKARTY
jgi:succinate dehydrogenase / fumarate reductase flavoprotein subunit